VPGLHAAAVGEDESEHEGGEDGREIQVIAGAARHHDGASQGDEEPALTFRFVQMTHRTEKEVKQHTTGDAHREVDDRPFGGSWRPHLGGDIALVIDGEHEPEGDHRHERVNTRGESEDGQDSITHPSALGKGVDGRRGA